MHGLRMLRTVRRPRPAPAVRPPALQAADTGRQAQAAAVTPTTVLRLPAAQAADTTIAALLLPAAQVVTTTTVLLQAQAAAVTAGQHLLRAADTIPLAAHPAAGTNR
jgi:hypothetical protein